MEAAEVVSISMEAAGTSMNRVKTAGAMLRLFLFWQKKGPTVRGGRLVPMALSVRTAKVWLPAANLQYGTDSGRRSSCSQHCGVPLWHIHW